MEKNNFSDSVDPAARKISDDIFTRISSDLSLDGFLDWESAILLDTEFLVSRRKIPDLSEYIGRDAIIIGPAKADKANLKIQDSDIVIVSGSAVENYDGERQPDFIVTDLDGDLAKLTRFSGRGSVCLVQAHGDNIEQIMHAFEICPGPVIPTCQVESLGYTTNFGGFTDGDRSVFFAHFLGCGKIKIFGFDFNSPIVKAGTDFEIKKKKLEWARTMLSELYKIRLQRYGKDNIKYL
ncbi:MAG: 6-hydroxymethylpterin diphosphokinase MptE-like protein [Thermoplasmata archaeon]